MAGSHRKEYGPIHPTPSIWNVHRVTASFEAQLRGFDEKHPRYSQVMNMDVLRAAVTDREWTYWRVTWDTAQKPWFDAAKEGKELLVDWRDDFRHFWSGSTHNTDPNLCHDSRVLEYL